ncbi:hypothetical protein [Corallococcus sp. CA049B]|uniref:hypothetical protein n=1 Tax=Corallococcus sp. CA049B TaxID=2316730 RepID=UPI0011C4475B|nr:hypothetical protein [Corallococcus sp. CA049B]
MEIRKQAGWGLGFALLCGLVVVALRQWAEPKSFIPMALLWCFACVAVGSIVGFIFGIPRALQQDVPVPSLPEANGFVSHKNPSGTRYRVNTNLEQISDWLTKIFVGLGLVQLQTLPERLHRAARTIATGLVVEGEKDAGAEPFAMALLLYFLTLGFFGGYLLTRLYLASALAQADAETELPANNERMTGTIGANLDATARGVTSSIQGKE